MSGLRALVALLVCLVAAAAVAVGRWEARRLDDGERRGIERVRALVGPLDSPSLKRYRRLGGVLCLLYRRDGRGDALELCFAPDGRLVSAVDRRGGAERRYSVRHDPDQAPHRVDVGVIRSLQRELAVAALPGTTR